MTKVKTHRFTKDANGVFRNPNATQTGIAQIMCAGDLMGEPGVQRAAFLDGKFDFTKSFHYVKEIFNKADIVLGNLETTVSTDFPYAMDQHVVQEPNYTRYLCNSPVEFLDAIKYAGFDVLCTANNHNLDYGIDGLKDTLANVTKHGFANTGIFKSKQKRHLLVDVNGIKLGILSYATWYNFNDQKLEQKDRDTYINAFSPERAKQDIADVKKEGAEFVLVYIHWGRETEYSHGVGQNQQRMAQELADAGADYIVGSHPHAIQEHDILKSSDGRNVPVVFSLSNFLTSDGNVIARKSIILAITLKRVKGRIEIADESYIPCYCAREFQKTRYLITPTIQKFNGGLTSEFLEETHMLAEKVMGVHIKPMAEWVRKKIIIGKPEVKRVGDKSRLCVDINIDGKKQEIWYEVDRKYEEYLCHERGDAFLVSMLQMAMGNRYDIVVDPAAPVTEELLYNLNAHYLPAYALACGVHHPKITATTTTEIIKNAGGVGTGMSCGVDSFHAAVNHLDIPTRIGPKLTHLVVNNYGFHMNTYTDFGVDKSRQGSYKRSKRVAAEMGLPIIQTDSNLRSVYEKVNQGLAVGFAVMCMRKLWKTFLFSSGYPYSDFKILKGDSERSDLLSTTFLSTEGLRIYSEGGSVTRFQKTEIVAKFPLAHKNLHVCWRSDDNCGTCFKCRRTMITLYLLDKLDFFREAFPVEYFYKNTSGYWKWLIEKVTEKEIFALDIVKHSQKTRHAKRIEKLVAGIKA